MSTKFQGEKVDCLFPAKYAQITLPSQGHYRVTLKSTLESCFYGKNTYQKPGALISQCRASFAQKKEENVYKRDFNQDSFSVAGVLYEKSTGKYL